MVRGLDEADVRTVFVSTASIAAVDDVATAPDVYRAKMPVEARSFEALGPAETLVDVVDATRPPIQPNALRAALDEATILAPEVSEPPTATEGYLRLLTATRTSTRRTTSRVHSRSARRTDVDGTLLAALGYVADEDLWWARSPHQELDPKQFWQPVSVTGPFGGTTEITRPRRC